MLNSFLEFNAQLKNNKIGIINSKINKIFLNYSFFHISEEFVFEENQIIYQNIKLSPAIIIDRYEEINCGENEVFFILGFKQTLLIIKESQLNRLHSLFSTNSNIICYFLSDCQDIFNNIFKNEINFGNCDDIFQTEISNFTRRITLRKSISPNSFNLKAFSIIKKCIASYLIKQSYSKLNTNSEFDFSSKSKEITNDEYFEENDFIELRNIGTGSMFRVNLIYHIEKEKLFAIKRPFGCNDEHDSLLYREINNYKKMNYPLLPKFYGFYGDKKNLIIEFINGKTLDSIENLNLNKSDKSSIIFQLLMIFNYLHKNEFVYRDLKPDNIMIDDQKRVYLIDFDRMLNISEKIEETKRTRDFASIFVSPEVNNGKISYLNDIYSLKLIMLYIENEKYPDEQTIKNNKSIIYKPSTISELIESYYSEFCSEIDVSILPKDPEIFSNLGEMHETEDFGIQDSNKSKYFFQIAANQNYPKAQFYLGLLYYEDLYETRDINKAIQYFSLAADQNYPRAQYYLGLIYYEDQFVKRDINKAIYYFSLAAKQNIQQAQFSLGLIYYDEKYVTQDINKAIHYFQLAEKSNNSRAQYFLGLIYYEGKYVNRDINKAIQYFSRAADQFIPKANFYLGAIYYEGKYVTHDINKAIYYFTLAAKANNPEAQFNLGLTYYDGKYVTRNITKAIHYLTQASYKNNTEAQYLLAVIYKEGKYVPQDIEKTIYFLSLAAKQNDSKAQYLLGVIYYDGKYVSRDIKKVIHYFELAAKNNHSLAQYNLGFLYYEGQNVEFDINKAIYYFQLAANENDPEAQSYLGLIYYFGQHVKRDINKAIHYFQLSADQNDPKSEFYLGIIYYENKYVKRDINKSIHYFSLSAKQNISQAQYNLGVIYYEHKYVAIDIYKAIHYFSLAAEQNNPRAQFYLGLINYEGKYIKRDINKAIHYFSIASNRNALKAQFYLGLLNYEGKYVTRDINKAIHYFTLSANQNCPLSQFFLGIIYYQNQFITGNIRKSIYYFSLAAKQNVPEAQLSLGIMYYLGLKLPKDVIKGQQFIIKSSLNGCRLANFAHGFMLHEGRYIKRDIIEAIHFYKEASTFDIQYAKNNLGIIYKHGFGDYVNKRIGNAIEYFNEAIRQKNDVLSMYNLAHIYIYEESIEQDINKSIDLLIKSSYRFDHSLILLCLILVKHFNDDFGAIKQMIKNEELSSNIFSIINSYNLLTKSNFDSIYESYRNIDFLYNINLNHILSSNLKNIKTDSMIFKFPNAKNVTTLFYEGFGHDLLK